MCISFGWVLLCIHKITRVIPAPDLSQVCAHKGAITSKIKHAVKLKTSPARLAQLLQPSLAFCFSLQPCKLKQNANEGCNSSASLAGLVLSFTACFMLLVIAP